jgi:hypothetical protein
MYDGAIPPPNAPPPAGPPMPIAPAVRKLEDADTTAEKKPRLEEPEWQAPQDVSAYKIDINNVDSSRFIVAYVLHCNSNTQLAR